MTADLAEKLLDLRDTYQEAADLNHDPGECENQRIANLLDEAAAALRKEWRPIETAPRDGTEVLLGFAVDRVRQGLWGPTGDSGHPFTWKDVSGSNLVRPWKDDVEPTHWQPLPAAPPSPGGARP